MEGLALVDDGENAADKLFAFEVGELAELEVAAEVGCVKGVASGAAKRAFLGDFNGKGWGAACEDRSPGVDHF